jgi:hypothetical protein
MKALWTSNKICFAPCANVVLLLKILLAAARRARTDEMHFIFPAGWYISGDFRPKPMKKMNLTRCGIFRGKIPQWKYQTNQTNLEERTHTAPKNNEQH